MRRLAPACLLAVLACTSPPAADHGEPGGTLERIDAGTFAIHYHDGDRPRVVLAGPELGMPVVLERWFDYADDPEQECELHEEPSIVRLEDGRVYLHWFNGWCWAGAGASACRVLDPQAGTWSEPAAGCLEPTACHFRVRGLAHGWLEVRDECEGFLDIGELRWTPEHGVLTRRAP